MRMLDPPFAKRKLFCVTVALLTFGFIATQLPEDAVTKAPMLPYAVVINGLIIAGMLTVGGMITYIPALYMRLHPIVRGAFLAAFVHLDLAIYTWPDQTIFWKTIAFAVVFGGLVDLLATQMFGEGEVVSGDMQGRH